VTDVGLNIVIIGRGGQLAWELQRFLPSLGRVTAVGRPEVDLLDPPSLRQMIRSLRPHVLVNAGAYTAVDRAESEPDRATAVNATAPQVLAEEASRINALLVAYSTDYVFDGSKASPYTEIDAANPLNVYGASKLAGDRAIEAADGEYLVLRTSWVYGPRGNNFLKTMMKLASERDEIRVVDDQTGAPTSSHDIAQGTTQILSQLSGAGRRLEPLGDRRGIYNLTSQGSVSWYGFAVAIVEELRRRGMKDDSLAQIVPISSAEYPTAAIRPRNSRLSNEKVRQVFGVALPQWNVSFVAAMDELGACKTTCLRD
jgi:dTDP-4-dehydrorhamnose reductase